MKLNSNFIRNSIYNLIGLGLPLLAAIFSIPLLIRALGESRFGLLTLILAIVSYFGLFDLGLGRAVTQQFARAVGAGESHRLVPLVSTANLILLALGSFAGLLLLASAPFASNMFSDRNHNGEISSALRWMALAMPFIILTSGFRGILEAQQKFAIINLIRVPMGLFTFLGPAVCVIAGHPDLKMISAVLALGRIVACVIHGKFALKGLISDNIIREASRSEFYNLVTTGGWLTISNIISPLMTYVDRFLIGIVAGSVAVAHYVTPQEIVVRLSMIPAALSTTLFPIFSQQQHANQTEIKSNLRNYSIILGLAITPFSLIVFLFSHLILLKWISPEFAEASYQILQILALASLFNSVANVPYTYLQGTGRASDVAKLHTVELLLYVPLVTLMTRQYGSLGAAIAWLARIVIDCFALFYLTSRAISQIDRPLPKSPQ